MSKTYLNVLRNRKVTNKIPKSIQRTIPIDMIFENGIFKIGSEYSKGYHFYDVNYETSSQEDKDSFILNYEELLKSFDETATVKITISNRKIDLEKFKEKVLSKHRGDNIDQYRDCYNDNILDKLKESDNLIQEKYITISVFKSSIEEANSFFARATMELNGHFARIGSKCFALSLKERLEILHDFYRGEKEAFYFDYKDGLLKGTSFKDKIAPDHLRFYNDYFQMNDKFGRTMVIKEYANYLDEDFISLICELKKNMMVSIDMISIPKDESLKEIQRVKLGADKNAYDWRVRQNRNNNYLADTPLELQDQSDECNEMYELITKNDEKMFMVSVTILHMANSIEELNRDTETLKSIINRKSCSINIPTLAYNQYRYLQAVLPIMGNPNDVYLPLLSHCSALLLPFRSQDIIDPSGIFYGINAITRNLIFCDKRKLQNSNSFIFGSSGGGKSFQAKNEIEALTMNYTDDQIYIVDPEGEYDEIVNEFQGQVVSISMHSQHHINAMDMSAGYGDSGNSVIDKSQFIMTLFEQMLKGHGGLSPIEKSIIDRCVSIVYEKARKQNYVPTLMHLYNVLLEQDEEESKTLAIDLELFTKGNLDIFAHETNVDINKRLVSFNIFDIPAHLRTIGFLVITDSILNKVNENWKKGIRTHVFIDEIHVVFENEESANFLASAWRQFRKRNAAPTGITQNVNYMLESKQGRTMLSNSEFVTMLNQSEADRNALAKMYNLSTAQLNHITNATEGHGLIKYGSVIVPFENIIPSGLIFNLNNTSQKERLLKEMKQGYVD